MIYLKENLIKQLLKDNEVVLDNYRYTINFEEDNLYHLFDKSINYSCIIDQNELNQILLENTFCMQGSL